MGSKNIPWANVISLFVSFAAAAFTGLQWWEARAQRQLASEATVGLDVNTSPSAHHFGIAVRNAGPGVAHIRSVKFYMDGHLLDDVDDAINRAELNSERAVQLELTGDVMGPGEINRLVDYHASKSEEDRAETFFLSHLSAAVEYCSADGRCATECSITNQCGVRR
jgi:hypothetical protein